MPWLYFTLLGLPLAELARRIVWGDLGANPVEVVTHYTGATTCYLLAWVIALGPLQALLPHPLIRWLARHRRMAGLWGFAYAQLHLLIWLLDQTLGAAEVKANLTKPFVLWGLCADAWLWVMALTSLRWFQRRLPWKRLHTWVWVLPLPITLHWMLKEEGNPERALWLFAPLGLLWLARWARGLSKAPRQ